MSATFETTVSGGGTDTGSTVADTPREVDVPADLAAAPAADRRPASSSPGCRTASSASTSTPSPARRTPETRQRRIERRWGCSRPRTLS